MKRRIYLSLLLGAVTGLVALGAGGPQGHTGGGGLTVPEAWRGTWEVTVAYRDHATGALVATDVTTPSTRPGPVATSSWTPKTNKAQCTTPSWFG